MQQSGPILDRGEGNHKRKLRLAKIRKGPGTFVYVGGLYDTEWTPTVLTYGKKVPLYNEDGSLALDAAGRQIFQREGRQVLDGKGNPVLGGPPKVKKTELKIAKVRGVGFPKGEAVSVGESLAIKLRCMGGFDEVVKEDDSGEEKPLYKMSKDELEEFAKNEGLVVPDGATKKELMALLEEKAEADAEG